MAKQKFYVVWEGVTPGVYTSWTDCQLQIKGYEGAKYKSFDTREEAERALATSPYAYIGKNAKKKSEKVSSETLPACVIDNSLAVDAACSGNPGPMEYRGVHIASRQEVFHFGPTKGTNNIGEFLAIVHGLALLKQKEFDMPIYSDQASAYRRNRGTVQTDRTCGEMASGKHIHHPYSEMGNQRMGRDSGRFWQKIRQKGQTPQNIFLSLNPR